MFLLILYNWCNWFCATLTPIQRLPLSFQIMTFMIDLPYYFSDWLYIVGKTYFSPFNSSYCMYHVSVRNGVGVETSMEREIQRKGWKKNGKMIPFTALWSTLKPVFRAWTKFLTFTCFEMFYSTEMFRLGRQLKIYNQIWNLFIRVIAIPAD